MFTARNDVVIVGAIAGRIAAKVDLGAVIFDGVVKRVEDFRRHQVSRHEHICALKCLCLQHLFSLWGSVNPSIGNEIDFWERKRSNVKMKSVVQ